MITLPQNLQLHPEIIQYIKSLSVDDSKALAILIDDKKIKKKSELLSLIKNLILTDRFTQEQILEILTTEY